ncbi:hypothetical protein E2C01_099038 [Portunus trituberculatus]|uniref:Uncharacterized protein n=1 Tax=Portunus trituberculatus TaxID=210409 RepID=A0A5B7K8I7_PORTR|nr:hypothetical protein [Portunus trituberculatus]
MTRNTFIGGLPEAKQQQQQQQQQVNHATHTFLTPSSTQHPPLFPPSCLHTVTLSLIPVPC